MNHIRNHKDARSASRIERYQDQPGDAELEQLKRLYLAVRRSMAKIVFVALLVGVIGYACSLLIDDKYSATAKVMLKTRVGLDPEYTTQVAGLPTTLTSLQSETEVLRSTDLLVSVIEELGLIDHAEFTDNDSLNLSPLALVRGLKNAIIDSFSGQDEEPVDPEQLALSRMDEVVEQLLTARQIQQVGDTSAVYSIRVTTRNPQLSAEIANAIAAKYLESQRQHKIEALRQDQAWLTNRTRELQEQLIGLTAQREALEIERPFSEEEYATIQAERTVNAQELRALQSRLVDLEDTASQNDIAALRSRIDEVEARYVELREAEALRASHDSQVSRIENEILVTETIYENFVGQLSRRTQQDEFLAPDARIIENARPNFEPSEPSRSMIAGVALIISLVLGVCFVMLRELMQRRLRTIREIEEGTGLPFFGVVPAIPKPSASLLSLATGEEKFDPVTMQFARKLRAALDAAVKDRMAIDSNDGIVLAGLSALRGEGQSFALAALVRSFSDAGLSVLIVDADPVGNAWHTTEDLKPIKRSSKLLPQERTLGVIPTNDPQIRLFYLSNHLAATKKQIEHGPTAFDEVLRTLRPLYDVIILDTPPLLDGIDTVVLHKLADVQVLFLRWNATSRDSVSTTLRLLEESRIEPIGVIATQVDLYRGKAFGESAFDFKHLTRRSLGTSPT